MANQKSIDLFIIGAPKTGSTALLQHLKQSPYISTHQQREMFYFNSDDEYRQGWDYAVKKYFPLNDAGLILAKNVKQADNVDAMVRLKRQCPNVKCIMMLREPAARAFSAFNYAMLRGIENKSNFAEALEIENERYNEDQDLNSPLLYIKNSTYSPKVRIALDIFGHDNLLVVFHEEYRVSPRKELAKIEVFVGKKLFDNVVVNLNEHNKAAKARSQWLAKLMYKVLQSNNPVKRAVRSIIPHNKATTIRHKLLDLNRVEVRPEPMDKEIAIQIKQKLAADRDELIKLIGYCPWK